MRIIAAVFFAAIMFVFNPTANAKEIIRHIDIDAPIEDVWKVIGSDFANAYKWASSLKHSAALDSISLNGSTCTKRGCDVAGLGKITEKLYEFSNDEHFLSYELIDGRPKFVRKIYNTWRLTTMDDGKTHVQSTIRLQTKGFIGWLLRWIMVRKTKTLVDETLEELKFYVETGKFHPRTIAASVKES